MTNTIYDWVSGPVVTRSVVIGLHHNLLFHFLGVIHFFVIRIFNINVVNILVIFFLTC